MFSLLRDQIWQFVFGILAIAVAVALFLLSRSRRELAFGVLSSRGLVAVDPTLAPRVTVSLDGSPVTNVHLIVLGLKNTGNTSIHSADFERSMNVSFGANARLLSAEVSRQHPPNLAPSLQIHRESLQIDPLLLNTNDFFVVQVLVSTPNPEVICDLRVSGVSAPKSLALGKPVKPNFVDFASHLPFTVLGSALIFLPFSLYSYLLNSLSLSVAPVSILDFVMALFPAPTLSGFIIFVFAALFTVKLGEWLMAKFTSSSQRYISDA